MGVGGVWHGRVQYSVLTLQLTHCFSTHARGWKRFASPVHYATSQNTNTVAEMKGPPKHYCTQWVAILVPTLLVLTIAGNEYSTELNPKITNSIFLNRVIKQN